VVNMEDTRIYGESPKIYHVETREYAIDAYRFEDWIIANIKFNYMLKREDSPELCELIATYIKTHLRRYSRKIIVSGRMPLWFFGALLHEIMHSFSAIAVFDPKLNGGVVVSSHLRSIRPFDLIELPDDLIAQLMQ